MIEKTNTVSFFTCTYEGDWELLLVNGRLNELIKRCNHNFASRNLIINNVTDKEKVKQYALRAIEEDVIDHFYFTEEYISDALQTFSLTRKDFKLYGFDGYWFSVGPLTAIYLCKTSYLLYFTADCILQQTYSFNWINAGISKLDDNQVLVVTPLWDSYDNNKENFIAEDDCCFYDMGFSDQAFMGRSENLVAINFNEYNIKSEVFPIYGGNHFERRVFCYMNNKNLQRCIFKDIVYKHEMHIKPGYRRKIGSTMFMDKLKYFIARAKIKIRKKILIKRLQNN